MAYHGSRRRSLKPRAGRVRSQAMRYSDSTTPTDYRPTLSRTWPPSGHLAVDREGFERAMDAQRQKSRASQAFDRRAIQEWTYASDEGQRLMQQTEDRFEGYTTTRVDGVPLVALFDADRHQVDELPSGRRATSCWNEPPFTWRPGARSLMLAASSSRMGQARHWYPPWDG